MIDPNQRIGTRERVTGSISDHVRMTPGGGRQPMPIVCWTVIHRAAASAASNLVHAAHPLRHFVGRGLHHGARGAAHAIARPAGTWAELVCKTVLPAAVAGGGLLAPVPAIAPPVPSPSTGYMQPAPGFSPWSSFGQTGLLQGNLPEAPPAIAPSVAETANALPPLTPESTFPVTPSTPTTPSTPGSPSSPSSPRFSGPRARLLLDPRRRCGRTPVDASACRGQPGADAPELRRSAPVQRPKR